MRKNLPTVPIQISLGRVSAAVADEVVKCGDGLSLKGRAILMLDPSGLERILHELDAKPEVIATILRAARLLGLREAAAAASAERADAAQGGEGDGR